MMIDIRQESQRQRFIDGELTIDQENDAIAQCELDPNLWRSLAVAFIEQRRLAAALSSNRMSDASVKSVASDLPKAGSVSLASQASSQRSSRWPMRAMVLAASVCLIGTLSLLGFEAGRQRAGSNTVTGQDEPAMQPIVVHIEYPTAPSNLVADFGSPTQNIFNDQAKAILRDAGYLVNESLDWRLEEEEDHWTMVPNREVRFVSLKE